MILIMFLPSFDNSPLLSFLGSSCMQRLINMYLVRLPNISNGLQAKEQALPIFLKMFERSFSKSYFSANASPAIWFRWRCLVKFLDSWGLLKWSVLIRQFSTCLIGQMTSQWASRPSMVSKFDFPSKRKDEPKIIIKQACKLDWFKIVNSQSLNWYTQTIIYDAQNIIYDEQM